jgi:hypothetical protein
MEISRKYLPSFGLEKELSLFLNQELAQIEMLRQQLAGHKSGSPISRIFSNFLSLSSPYVCVLLLHETQHAPLLSASKP